MNLSLLCNKCRGGDHSGHTDDGLCRHDNIFNGDCRCLWRPEGRGQTKIVVEVPCIVCGLVIVIREFEYGDNVIVWYSDICDYKCDVCFVSEK